MFIFIQPTADGAVASEPNAGQRLVIWGTDVNVGTCKEKFQVLNLAFQVLENMTNSMYKGVNCLHALGHFAFRDSCRDSLTRPPLKMRTLVWT